MHVGRKIRQGLKVLFNGRISNRLVNQFFELSIQGSSGHSR